MFVPMKTPVNNVLPNKRIVPHIFLTKPCSFPTTLDESNMIINKLSHTLEVLKHVKIVRLD